MNKLVIIPVCNFFDCFNQIIAFYDEHLDEANIVIIDDSTDSRMMIIHNITGKYNLITLRNNKKGYLSNAFLQGIEYAEKRFDKQYDLIITNEHDVVPNVETLYACLSAFENKEIMRDIASVSTIYKWKGQDCYPTHPHWYNGWTILNVPGVGECKVIGAQGVPFGFTLWKPQVLKLLNNKTLPPIWKLDSHFGQVVYDKGYHHIRLIDYFVEHYNGGVKSWKK